MAKKYVMSVLKKETKMSRLCNEFGELISEDVIQEKLPILEGFDCCCFQEMQDGDSYIAWNLIEEDHIYKREDVGVFYNGNIFEHDENNFITITKYVDCEQYICLGNQKKIPEKFKIKEKEKESEPELRKKLIDVPDGGKFKFFDKENEPIRIALCDFYNGKRGVVKLPSFSLTYFNEKERVYLVK